MFICGSKSLRSARQDEDDNESCDSPCRTPKRSRLAGFLRSTNANRDKISKSNNNPYAERGLDKFYQLVAENKDKTQKIYAAELGSKDISLVRFVYGNDSNDVRPIVIRNRDKNSQLNNSSPRDSTNTNDLKEIPWRNVVDDEKKNKKIKKRRVRCNVNSFWLDNDFAVILVWILLLLAMSGRVFAILCTSIGWYMIATIVPPVSSSSLASGRKLKRKKEHVKKLSGDEETVVHNSKGSSSPKSVLTTYKSTAACA